jgi:UDP-glucose 4-epimerase
LAVWFSLARHLSANGQQPTANCCDNSAVQKTAVLTGAGGFLAGHFANAFASAGWRVVGIGRSDPNHQSDRYAAFHLNDLSDADRVLSILDRSAADVVVHLAAPASVPESLRNPPGDFRAHVLPTVNALEAVRLARAPIRVILVSSAAVYGDPASLPVSEDAPLRPISPYGFHKMHQELLVDEYVRLHGVRACKARIFSTYGENLRRLAVWEIARRALRGERVALGSGEETRDYLYAGDAGRAIAVIAERAECNGEAINVAAGEEVAMRTVAAQVYAAAGIAEPPRFTGEALQGSPTHWRADIRRLRALGFDPPEWSNGLARTVQWIRSAV